MSHLYILIDLDRNPPQYKVGITSCDVNGLLSQYQRQCPRSEILFFEDFDNSKNLESLIKREFSHARVINNRGNSSEWFTCEIYKIINFIYKNGIKNPIYNNSSYNELESENKYLRQLLHENDIKLANNTELIINHIKNTLCPQKTTINTLKQTIPITPQIPKQQTIPYTPRPPTINNIHYNNSFIPNYPLIPTLNVSNNITQSTPRSLQLNVLKK
jgi:hypothetical protein